MIDKDLKIYDSVCTGCSACTEACAFPDEDGINPIQIFLNKDGLNVPRINSEICTECMMCYKACPTEDKIFNNHTTFKSYTEKIGSCYFGYSLNNEHRYEAATAGIATEIAAYLLKTNQIDGVVSSYQSEDNKTVTEIFTDSNEVKKTRGSIYRQVSMLNGLAEKIEKNKYKKLLLIGLPCHVAGLKTLQKANKYLRKNVEFITIALFCKQTKTEEFSDMQRIILNAKSKQKIDYRGKGWPGFTSVEGGRSLPFTDIKIGLSWGSFSFAPAYCFSCSDPIGVEADISVGDAWLPQYLQVDKKGSSLFVANTKLGDSIIKEIARNSIIYIKDETKENIIKSQNKKYIMFKTRYQKFRSAFFADINIDEKIDFKYRILSFWIKYVKKSTEELYRRNIFEIFPDFFIKIYRKLTAIGWKFINLKENV